MSTSPDASSLTKGLLDDELIDLEPSLELEVADFPTIAAGTGSDWCRERSRASHARSTRSAAAAWARPPFFWPLSSRSCFSGVSSGSRPITGW